jgi:hypothetical protein
MEYTRKDLLTNFPIRFSKSELYQHFASEYEKLFGSRAPHPFIDNVAKTFVIEWKKFKNRASFLRSSAGKRWLEKKLILPDATTTTTPVPTPTLTAGGSDVTPKRPLEGKTRKPFEGICVHVHVCFEIS